MGRVGKLCMKSGITKRNPVPEWKKNGRNAQKKLIRLRQRVRNMSTEKTMPMMAFVHFTQSGSLKIVGSETLVSAIENSNLLDKLRPNKEENTGKETTIDVRDVSLCINFGDVTDAHLLRKALSQVVVAKGVKGCRSVWGDERKKPEWWGDAIKFVSPSSTYVDNDGKKHRNLTTADVRVLLSNWQGFIKKKISCGAKPLNFVDDDDVIRKLRAQEDATQGNGSQEDADCCQLSISIKRIDSELAMAALGDGSYCQVHLQQIINGKTFPAAFTPTWDVNHRRRFYGVPWHLIPCGKGVKFGEVFGPLPAHLTVQTFVFALQHMDHYVKQLMILGETGESLKERFSMSMDKANREEEEEPELQNLALLAGPLQPCLATIMFLAGFLQRDIIVFSEETGLLSVPPCPCTEHRKDPINFFVDKGQRSYQLAEKAFFGDDKHASRTGSTMNKFPKRHQTILEAEDKRIILYKNLEVSQLELDFVKRGRWLDDHVVDACVRIYRDELDKKVDLLLSSTGQLLQQPNIDARRIGKIPTGKYLLPICAGNHWFLLAGSAHSNMILCSMGGTYRTIERNVNRIFGRKSKTVYEKTPRQSNGFDCGVFTIMYAREIMKKQTWTTGTMKGIVCPKVVEQTGRAELLDLLNKWKV